MKTVNLLGHSTYARHKIFLVNEKFWSPKQHVEHGVLNLEKIADSSNRCLKVQLAKTMRANAIYAPLN